MRVGAAVSLAVLGALLLLIAAAHAADDKAQLKIGVLHKYVSAGR